MIILPTDKANRDNLGRFVKGHKGLPNSGSFKKGCASPSKGRKFPERCGRNHPNWRGGKTKDKSGYVFVKQRKHPFCNPIGYVREHRLIVEKQIGRYLLPEERVHHRNKKKDDNRAENLMAFINDSAHIAFERLGKVKPEEIVYNGRNKI